MVRHWTKTFAMPKAIIAAAIEKSVTTPETVRKEIAALVKGPAPRNLRNIVWRINALESGETGAMLAAAAACRNRGGNNETGFSLLVEWLQPSPPSAFASNEMNIIGKEDKST